MRHAHLTGGNALPESICLLVAVAAELLVFFAPDTGSQTLVSSEIRSDYGKLNPVLAIPVCAITCLVQARLIQTVCMFGCISCQLIGNSPLAIK